MRGLKNGKSFILQALGCAGLGRVQAAAWHWATLPTRSGPIWMLIFLAILMGCSGGGSDSGNGGGTTVNPPVINSFVASAPAITAGETTTLVWNTSGATSLSISGLGSITPAGGSTPVTPTATTTYTLSATNAGGTVTSTATVTVSYRVTFQALPGGTLNGTLSQSVPAGGACAAVTAVPNTGYAFTDWTGNGFTTSNSNPLTVSNVNANLTITANFALQTFTVNFAAGTGGNLGGTSSQVVNYGGSCSPVTAVPSVGYTFTNWTGSGFTTSTASPLTVSNVTSNLTLTANFTLQTFTVNFIAGIGGSLSGAPSQVVSYGGSCAQVTAIPSLGYTFTNWTGSGFTTSTASVLTVNNVTSNLTITANFTPQTFTVNFIAGIGGSLSGGSSQVVNYGGSCSPVSAVPSVGYSFGNWTGSGFTTSTANPLTVGNVTSNLTLTANFTQQTFTVSFVAGTGGSLSGTPSQVVNFGGSCAQVTAIPSVGYTFTNWTGSGFTSSTATALTVSNVTSNLTLTANFTPQTFTVNFIAGAGGTLTGTASQVLAYGVSSAAVTAVPNPGYTFANWTGGGFSTSATNPLIVNNVTSNLAITANFTPLTPTVSFAAGSGGSLSGSSSQVVNYGGSTTPVTAVPGVGYKFTNWTGSGFSTTAANPLTVNNVTSNLTITANFGPNNPTVTFQAGTGGTLSGNTNQTLAYGGSATPMIANPGLGYVFVNWTGSGGFSSNANPLTLNNVTSNQTITANFALQTFTVNFLAGANGALTGNTSQTVAYGGSTALVTANPNASFLFLNWTGAGFTTSVSNPMAVANVTSNMTITANFVPQSLTVTFVAGAGGTLTGTASQVVAYGTSATAVTAVPNLGYTFTNWTGSGFTTSTSNPLTVSNVTSNMTITANFTVQTFTVNFAAGTGGSLTGTTSQLINYGASCTAVTAVPVAGYTFNNWTGSGFTTSVSNPLTVSNVTASQTITANFIAPTPTITSFLPVTGAVGTSVVIIGTGLLGATTVSFSGTNAVTFVVNSVTQITATVPVGATSGTISVTTSGGTGASAGAFTVNTSTLDLTVPTVYISQATQTQLFDVPLVKGRNGYLRVFVIANQANTATPQVRVRIYDASSVLVQTYTINAPGAAVPLSVNESAFANSWNQAIPNTYIQPNYKLLVDVDPTNAILESNHGNNSWPVSGTPQTLDVRDLQPFHLTFVPVTTTDGTGNVTAGNMASFTVTAQKLHPIPSMDLALRGSALNSSTRTLQFDNANNDWQNVLDDLTALRNTDPGGTNRYYYGVVKTSYNSGIIGRSWIPGNPASTSYRASIGWDKLPSGDSAAAHELGHAMGRPHAPGCGVAGPDVNWPVGSNYAGGLIGVWGLDPSGPTLYNPATYYDHMDYCSPSWVSDYGFKRVLAFRETSPIGLAAPSRNDPAQPTQSLLLWGSIIDGELVLHPSFQLPVEPQPPEPGDHYLTGYDAAGAKVFEVSFNPVAVADGLRPSWGFNFTVPLLVEAAARLVEIQWTKAGEILARQGGPVTASAKLIQPTHEPMLQVLQDGRTRLLWDASVHLMVLVKDRATGLGIGFGRNGDFSFESEADELEIHFSNGVRSHSTVLRRPRLAD